MRFTFGLSTLVLIAIIGTALLSGCSQDSKLAVENPKSGGLWAMAVTSSAFANSDAIPAKYSAEGGNISPPLKWNSGPNGTKEYVVIMQDADTFGDRPNNHWIVYGIPAGVTSLSEGSMGEYKQGKNYKGEIGYTGPANTIDAHRYFFQVFALDRPLDVEAGADGQELAAKFEGWVLSKGQLIGTFQK